MNKRAFLIVMLGLVVTTPASAYQLAGYQWSEPSTTFYVSIPGAAPSGTAWNDAFVAAAAAWNTRTLFDFNMFAGSADPCAVPTGTGDRNGVGFSASKCGSAFGATTLAITRNWSLGDELVQSGIVFNNASIAWDVYSGPWRGSQEADFRRVAVHELGHALGLSHASGGIMSAYAGNTTVPTADDIAGVNSLYGAPPPAASPPPEDDPPPEETEPPPDSSPPANPPTAPGPAPPEPLPDEIFAGGFEAQTTSSAKNSSGQSNNPARSRFDQPRVSCSSQAVRAAAFCSASASTRR